MAKPIATSHIGTTVLFLYPSPIEDQVEKLRNLVYLKNTFGHFMWTYLSSIVALFASMIALLMASS
jgi:hypothetical protein